LGLINSSVVFAPNIFTRVTNADGSVVLGFTGAAVRGVNTGAGLNVGFNPVFNSRKLCILSAALRGGLGLAFSGPGLLLSGLLLPGLLLCGLLLCGLAMPDIVTATLGILLLIFSALSFRRTSSKSTGGDFKRGMELVRGLVGLGVPL
jgi:hypothetical protein